MREFWVASGHHLTRRADHGGLVATPELIMAYLARPELMPPADACEAERNLHASLLADPLRPVSGTEIAALADADARENWSFMMNFRDKLIAAPSLEAVYVALSRKGAGDLPPIFVSQLCHLILRNALEGCDDPYTLRAAELFYRSQLATIHEGTLLLADAEVIEAEQHAQHDIHASPLTAMLQPKPFGEMDVMDDENAWTYWSRSDAHAMVMNLGGNAKARAGLCRVIERWIGHLLGVAVKVETVPSIEDRDWRWFVGLDSEGTRIGNALWNGDALDGNVAERVVALMRLTIEDTRLVDERVGNKPVYLILAMGADKVVRLKPQNLVVGLPLAATATSHDPPPDGGSGMALIETSREVGVVLRRRSIDNPWIDHLWSPAMILDEVPATAPWTALSTEADATVYYAGPASIALFSSDTANYRDNLADGAPRIWVALRRQDGGHELELTKVTADPTEGEAMFESGCDVIGTVPMPAEIAAWIAAFVDQFHVERVFHKRKRDRAGDGRGPMPGGSADNGTDRT